MKLRVAALLPLSVLLTVPAFATRFRVADASKVVSLADPEISPDGRSVVVVASHANLDEDRMDTQLLLVDVQSHETRVLSARSHAGFPRWSPDGKMLAFLADDDKKHLQIWTMSMTSAGDSTQLTHLPASVSQFAWRPDGQALALVAEEETPERKGRARFADEVEIGNNDFLVHAEQKPAHLWVVDLPPKGAEKMPEPKRLTSGTWSLPITLPPGPPSSPVQWSPDGKLLYFVKVPTPRSGDSRYSTIQVIEVATGHTKPLTGATMYESRPVLSPDGTQVAYLSPRDGKPANDLEVMLTSAGGGGGGRDISSKVDRNLVRAIWMPGGKNLLVGGADHTTAALWILPTDGGPAERISTGTAVPSQPFWVEASVSQGGEIAFTGSSPSDPSELFLIDASHGNTTQLTQVNAEIASLEVARQETVTWPSMKGGPASDGVLTFPIGYQPGKRYPLVLYIHGGPTSSSKQSWSTFAQLFAAQGWMVFEPNYRGSDNLGNTYKAAIWNDAGQGPGEDVMAGLAVLEKRNDVDTGHIAVSGWSYGGYMTSWLLGHSTIWKASVDGAAVNDWLDQYNLGDGNVRIADSFGGSPYSSPELLKSYRDQSPITYAAAVRTPTLILSDVGDYRVPITQSYSFFRVLRDHNVLTQFIAYPVPGHFPGDPIRREDIYRRWIEWLGRYLPSDPGAEATAPARSETGAQGGAKPTP